MEMKDQKEIITKTNKKTEDSEWSKYFF
jgi:hypothetical protein